MGVCPLTGHGCMMECAWFRDGECCVSTLPDLVEKMEDAVTSIAELEQTVRNKDFQM